MLVLVTVILLISQGIRFKYEALQRESAQLESQLKMETIKSSNLRANYQMLTAEELIKKFAADELGLVDAGTNLNKKIIILNEDIVELSETMINYNE
jgi:hypothetical protein